MGNTAWEVGEGNKGSVTDDHVAFVDLPEQDRAEVDGPDLVVGLVQADVVLFEGIGDEEQPVFQPEGTGVGDALYEGGSVDVHFTLPLTILTLGLFLLVVNAAMFGLAAALVSGFRVRSFWAALVGSVLLNVFNVIISVVFGL